ncbi:tripartite tricarboxylate transporter substrate binding protein [Roseomonas sp. AR75]|jgi:tripartite-type tricarboxylate transporter receptor subunit TctC|uniref:Bug family tripartite tricarboxylate transporter substrate binding protein n=1 Tax=Roseomonas sp. AR75 TaxID=2562311 RepID=UPI0010BFA254|nr:tripartite tricarboxylate transporter substrate-binding protein [Roseomonas sp. AR75]
MPNTPACLPRGLTRRTALLALGATSLAGRAQAQSDWPTRPIRILVGYPAGGANDLVARAVAQPLSETLKVPVTVENRTGAAGTIAADAAKRAAPDGEILYMMSSAQVLAPAVRKDVGFDPVADFTPIALCASAPYFLVVHNSVPARNVAELVALAKARPGQLSFASSGVGAGPHLTSSLFMAVAGIEMNHVPYRGDADAMVDLTAGRVQVSFISVAPTWPHIQSGALRGLAVSSAERIALAPNIPTVAESGYAGFDMGAWWGLVGPKGLPRPIVDKVANAVRPILDAPAFAQRFADQGVTPGKLGPDAFAQRIAQDKERFADIVRRAGISPS